MIFKGLLTFFEFAWGFLMASRGVLSFYKLTHQSIVVFWALLYKIALVDFKISRLPGVLVKKVFAESIRYQSHLPTMSEVS